MWKAIRLLGRPAILDEVGREQPLRGHKAWAILARVVLSRRPVFRQELAGELFAEADDPLGSLRWSLAILRKGLGSSASLSGDPLELRLADGTRLDIASLETGDIDIEQVGALLEGVEPRSSPEFSTWLLVERERMASMVASRLRQDTIRAIAIEDHERAIRLAELGVRRAPFDETFHVLLAKGLAMAGRPEAALRHVEATEATFLAELGEKPSPALRSAARATVSSPPAGISGAIYVRSLIESGLAALSAGAADAGIDCLRRAVQGAAAFASPQLHGRALLELGTALVHFARSHADEGSVVLRQAADLALAQADPAVAAAALRELGFVEFKAGRRPSAAVHFTEALERATDDAERGGILAVAGLNLVDWGRVDAGLAQLQQSLDHARSSGNRRREIVALAYSASGLLADGRAGEACDRLDHCLSLVDEQRWMAFRPWPVALRAESAIRQGRDPASVLPGLEESFALSCQLGDPCWEAASARAIALAHAWDGKPEVSMNWLTEARRRCTADPCVNVSIHVNILADQAAVSASLGRTELADAFGREWLSLAARTHMDAHVELAAAFVTGGSDRTAGVSLRASLYSTPSLVRRPQTRDEKGVGLLPGLIVASRRPAACPHPPPDPPPSSPISSPVRSSWRTSTGR